jgi:hypothetical protein
MTIFIISALVAVALIFALMKFGKIEDKDGNNIPDVVDTKIKQTKERAKRVSEEAADVVKAVKEVAKQTKDVVEAAKGDKRKGKKASK